MRKGKERACLRRLPSVSWKSTYERNGPKPVNKGKTSFSRLNCRFLFDTDGEMRGLILTWAAPFGVRVWNRCRRTTDIKRMCDTSICAILGAYEISLVMLAVK